MFRKSLDYFGAFAGSVFICTGCALPSYRPITPHVAAGQGLHASVTRLDVGSGAVAIWVELHGDHGARVRRAVLAPTKAPPCREGIRDHGWVLDGKSLWVRPASVKGQHTSRFEFPGRGAHEMLKEGAAVDFVVASDGGDRCVRVPLNGPDPDLAWHAEVRGSTGASVRAYAPTGSAAGVGLGWALVESLGAHIGPLRFQGELGVGTAFCRSNCSGSNTGFFWAPVGASAHAFVFDNGRFGVDLGLGYRWFFAAVGSGSDSRSVTLAAPELTVRFTGATDLGPGLSTRPPIASSGIEIIVSDWRFAGPTGSEHTLVFGMALTWDRGF